MRKRVTLLLILTCAICHAQLSQKTINAMTWGAKTKITFQVVDYDGRSVSNANIRLYWTYDYTNKTKKCSKTTSKDGLVVLEEKSRGTFTYFVEKDGYYKSQGKYSFDVRGETRVKDGRWEPWNPTVEIVLKEKRNPIPMYSNKEGGFFIQRNELVGFDFEKGELVSPHGNGEHPDIFLLFSSNAPLKFTPARTNSLEISTINDDEGFIKRTCDLQSEFKSSYDCPETGYDKSVRFSFAYAHNNVDNQRLPGAKYLIFRTRARHDEKGNLLASRYGKIYDISFDEALNNPGKGFISLNYKFNPVENDRNIEWNGENITTGKTKRSFQP
jgi:hypothetical protein